MIQRYTYLKLAYGKKIVNFFNVLRNQYRFIGIMQVVKGDNSPACQFNMRYYRFVLKF